MQQVPQGAEINKTGNIKQVYLVVEESHFPLPLFLRGLILHKSLFHLPKWKEKCESSI